MITKNRKPASLTQCWNTDNTVTLYARGKKVYGPVEWESAEAFARGWYDVARDEPIPFGRRVFRDSKKQK